MSKPKTFYFAHNFNDRKEFREIEAEIEKTLGILLFNPFYDNPDRVEEMRQLDSTEFEYGSGKTELEFSKRDSKGIVQDDLKNLAAQEALFTIVRKPSFGTAIEMCCAVLMRKPIYFVSENYSEHPWIVEYTTKRFKTVEDFLNWYGGNK